jgi:hypothetical protein
MFLENHMPLPFRQMSNSEIARKEQFLQSTIVYVSVLMFVNGNVLLFELTSVYGFGWSPSRNEFNRDQDLALSAQASMFLDAGVMANLETISHFRSVPVLMDNRQRTTHEYLILRWPESSPPRFFQDRRGSSNARFFDPLELPEWMQLEEDRLLIAEAADTLPL